MPNNTDNSGVARAANLRRMAASNGPVGILPVRPNIGSMALDRKMFVIKYLPPPPPSGLSAVAGNGSATVSFTHVSINDKPITNYQYSLDGSNFTALSPPDTSSPVTITGLTNGTPYTIYLKAVNAVGTSVASSASNSVTPAGPPFVPSGLSAVAGNGSATVSFTAGSDNGRSIINYQYSTNGTTFTQFSPAVISGPVTITGLTNGTPYTIYLKAVNAVGTSTASSSVSVTPAGPPSAPSSLSAVAGNGSATVSFTAGSDNGRSITNYEYSTNGITFTPFSPADTSSPVTITGLNNGSPYTIYLKAVNAVGLSEASSSVSVTPAGTPSAPFGLSAVAGDSSATVSFTAGSNNGSPITNYQYSTNESIFTALNPPDTSSPVTITGLNNGTPYIIYLKAINAVGLSEVSSASNSVTPVSATVAAPSLVLSLAADKGAYIYFTQIGTVTNYQYTTDNGANFTVLSPAANLSPIFITGLTNNTPYTVQLQALDSMSNNSVSSNAISVTPTATSNATAAALLFDPNQSSSYSGSGTSLSNIGSSGTINGNMTNVGYVTGPTAVSNVFSFSGSSYITFPAYNFGTQITLCAWINPQNKESINGLLTNTTSNQTPNGFKIGWNSWLRNNKCCYFEAGNGSSGSSNATIDNVVTLNTWQHYGCVFDQANQQVIFFINGVPINIRGITTVANIGTNKPFRIGAFMDGSYSMNASLGTLKIFNYLFNATDMMNDYNTSKALYGL